MKEQVAARAVFRIASLTAAAIFCASASAADTEFVGRYYLSPMYSRVFADKNRLGGDGNGGIFAVGKQLNARHNFELYVLGVQYGRTAAAGSADIKGAAGAFSYFPFADREGVSHWLGGAYGLVGAGFGNGHTDAKTLPARNGNRYLFEVGAGYLLPLFRDISLRLDGRYRFDQQINPYDGSSKNAGKSGFDEPLASVGLLIPLGKKAEPPAPVVVPVEVVPVAGAPSPPPPVDTDGDGVFDPDDQCPDTPPNTKVDTKGCPLPVCKEPKLGERISLAGCGTGDKIVLRGVNFEFDQSRLTPNAKTILDNVSDELKANPNISVELGGHTDSKGSDAYNQRLSEQRVRSVRRHLIEHGIAESRLTALGYGESQPVADNATQEGRDLNRRVELKITSGMASAVGVAPAAEAVAPTTAASAPAAPAPAPTTPEAKSAEAAGTDGFFPAQ